MPMKYLTYFPRERILAKTLIHLVPEESMRKLTGAPLHQHVKVALAFEAHMLAAQGLDKQLAGK